MAKPSSELVDEAAETKRQFDEMREKVNSIHDKLFASEEKPVEKPKAKGEQPPEPTPKTTTLRGFFEGLGILAKE